MMEFTRFFGIYGAVLLLIFCFLAAPCLFLYGLAKAFIWAFTSSHLPGFLIGAVVVLFLGWKNRIGSV